MKEFTQTWFAGLRVFLGLADFKNMMEEKLGDAVTERTSFDTYLPSEILIIIASQV